ATSWMVDLANVRPIDGKPERIGFAGRMEDDPVMQPTPAAPAAPLAMAPTSAPEWPAKRPAAGGDTSDEALRRHHTLMTRFLESHRSVMLAALGARQSAEAMPVPPVKAS